jgi:hypothetical protein
MTQATFDPERLRPPEYVGEADPRSTMFVRVDRVNGTSRAIELADHHGEISAFALHAGVPQRSCCSTKRPEMCIYMRGSYTAFIQWRSLSAWRVWSSLCASV